MADEVVQYVRTYAYPEKKAATWQRKKSEPAIQPSEEAQAILRRLAPYGGRVLLFDTETTADAAQRLRFGFYEVHGISEEETISFYRQEQRGERRHPLSHADSDFLQEAGFFYNPEVLTTAELATLEAYVADHRLSEHAEAEGVGAPWLVGGWYDPSGNTPHYQAIEQPRLRLLTVQQFVERLYELMKAGELLIVGHNLPFDLSRLATSWTQADGDMRGGFSLKLCSCPHTQCFRHPAIRLKHLGFAKTLFKLQKTKWNGRATSWQSNVHFLDTVTLGKALLGQALSLAKLGEVLQVLETRRKLDIDEETHGQLLTADYLDYARRDVLATFTVYQTLRALYKQHDLATPMWNIYSEASLGKAYLKAMEIPPFLEAHPDFPPEVLGYAMQGYYGGRSEVHIRLQPTEVSYCDFKSQYPTINALLGLQGLLLAKAVTIRDVTAEIQAMLASITLSDLQQPSFWQRLRVLVKVKPNEDILPVRAAFGEAAEKNIAVTYVSGPEVWYTLADVIASTLLTGKAPEVLEALELVPSGGQAVTQPITLFGDKRYRLDLQRDDFFTKVIDLRSEIKQQMKAAGNQEEAAHFNSLQLALKLLANSTSYGALVEINQEEATKNTEPAMFYTADGEARRSWVDRREIPGKYFAGPIGALIPAGGRLLLAIAEKLAEEHGITYAMCDTDSMAFARPDCMDRAVFRQAVASIRDWFTLLSPYTGKPPIFEDEDVNRWQDAPEPLYFLGVSAKRYVLYNRVADGSYRIRKFSSHGLGALNQPYADHSSKAGTPEPSTNVHELGGPRWVYDLWYHFIAAWEAGSYPDGSALPSDEDGCFYQPVDSSLKLPAFHRVTNATAHLNQQFSKIPDMRPFNFFTVLPALPMGLALFWREIRLQQQWAKLSDEEIRHRRALYDDLAKTQTPFYAPYARRPEQLQHIRRCDRHEEVSGLEHTTILESVADYFRHAEWKANTPQGRGALQRRHLVVTGLRYIGKESNDIKLTTAAETDGLLASDALLDGALIYANQQHRPQPGVYESLAESAPDESDASADGIKPGNVSTAQLVQQLQGCAIGDLMLATGLSQPTLSALQAGKLDAAEQTKARVLAGLPMLDKIASWRDLPVETLTATLDMDANQIRALRAGELKLPEERRIVMLEKLTALPYQDFYEQAEEARYRKEQYRQKHAVVKFLQEQGYIRPYRKNLAGKIPEMEEYRALPSAVRRLKGALAMDEAADMVGRHFPETGIQTDNDLRRFLQ